MRTLGSVLGETSDDLTDVLCASIAFDPSAA